MERLIITADESLYRSLAEQAEADGDVPAQASTVLQGLEQAVTQQPGLILLDMALRSADTLLETLYEQLAQLPAAAKIIAIAPTGCLPYSLRRFCSAVVNRESVTDADD